MRHFTTAMAAVAAVLISESTFLAQTPQAPQAPATSVPRLINVTGVFRPADGQPPAATEVVTLGIYADETGSTPIWEETQSVAVDRTGRYTLLLGATRPDGVPVEVFASGEARWLGMVWERTGEVAGARTRITSVPYALRASDADTLGGKPASSYLLAPSAGGPATSDLSTSGAVTSNLVNPGTVNMLAKYVNASDVGDSAIYEAGGLVGVNTTAPLDVIHSRFYNESGNMTGLAVQNTAGSATSYSGMLFYDQNGALGQFQGFNNSTHEYRINNIASGGSINFMLGSSSKFLVAPGGNIGVGVSSPASRLTVAGDLESTAGELRTLGTLYYGLRWVNGSGAIQAHLHRWGFGDGNLYITNAGAADLTGVYLAPNATSLTSTSDERLKTDIEPVTGILDKIKNIRVVSFNMASLSADRRTGKAAVNLATSPRTMKNGKVIKQQIGSVAQDWLADFPELVVEPQSEEGYYGLNYDRIGVVALGGVKELDNLLTEKDAEIKALNARVAALEKLVQQLSGPNDKQPQPRQ